MCVVIASEQLRLAAYGLATGPEPIRERLITVWKLHVEYLDLEDGPEFLRRSLVSVQQGFSPFISDGNVRHDSTTDMTDERAIDLVQRMLYLADDLNQIATLTHYKHIVSEQCLDVKEVLGSATPRPSEGDAAQPLRTPPLNLQQKLQLAVYALAAGAEPLHLRFARAWGEQLTNVEVTQFPECLRRLFVGMRDEVRGVVAVSLNAAEALATLPEGRMRHLASELFLLSERMTELSIVRNHRHSLGA